MRQEEQNVLKEKIEVEGVHPIESEVMEIDKEPHRAKQSDSPYKAPFLRHFTK